MARAAPNGYHFNQNGQLVPNQGQRGNRQMPAPPGPGGQGPPTQSPGVPGPGGQGPGTQGPPAPNGPGGQGPNQGGNHNGNGNRNGNGNGNGQDSDTPEFDFSLDYPQRRARRWAQQDTEQAFDPVFNQIDRSADDAITQYGQGINQVQSLYDALGQELKQTGEGFTGRTDNIADTFNENIGDLKAMFGDSFAGASTPIEGNAALGVLGSQAGAGNMMLSNDAQRNADYLQSTQTQGELERMTTARNRQQDLQQFLDDLSRQRADIGSQQADYYTTALRDARQTLFENQLAKGEFGLRTAQLQNDSKGNDATAAYLEALINDLFGRKHSGRNGNGRNGVSN